MNRYDTNASFVMADQAPTVATPETSLLRRQDVVEASTAVIRAYSEQQNALLGRLQDDVVGGGSGGFLSNADQVAERRKTSGMYLRSYLLVSALTTGGLAYLAHLAGADQAAALAGWLAGTGALTLLLAWRRHGQEMELSPEGTARHLLDWHGEIASYESETRRLSLQWEFQAEERRQAAQERAAEHARQQAQLRIDELDARRKAIEAQRSQADPYVDRYRGQWGAEQPPVEQSRIEPLVIAEGAEDITEPITTPAADDTIGHWRDSLLLWIATLYQPGTVTEAGVIRTMVPWSARSSWLEQDKAEARRVMCEMRPALIVHDGNRWRLRTEVVSDVEQALQLVRQRL